jgi:hypothetical protein
MTTEYKQLTVCERQLRDSLITKTVLAYPTTNTSQYRLRAYRLLSHAEIEFYIENLVLSKIENEKAKWNSTKTITNSIGSLLSYSKFEFPNVSSHLSEVSSRNDAHYRITTIITIYENNIKKNNGIKEENIIPILIPIGIEYQSISQTLLNNLSSFGRNRGNTAHNSSKVQQLINPNDEINIVSQILQELVDIDRLVVNIK